MPYCTLNDLQKAIPQQTLVWLSNDDHAALEVNAVVIDAAIQYACELIDAHIAGRYELPLATLPTVLPDMAVNLARHWLYARRPEGHDFPEAVTRTYTGAIKMLESLQAGRMTLGVQSTGATDTGSAVVKVNARPRQFGADVLGRY